MDFASAMAGGAAVVPLRKVTAKSSQNVDATGRCQARDARAALSPSTP
jgi:hypothetical protein